MGHLHRTRTVDWASLTFSVSATNSFLSLGLQHKERYLPLYQLVICKRPNSTLLLLLSTEKASGNRENYHFLHRECKRKVWVVSTFKKTSTSERNHQSLIPYNSGSQPVVQLSPVILELVSGCKTKNVTQTEAGGLFGDQNFKSYFSTIKNVIHLLLVFVASHLLS